MKVRLVLVVALAAGGCSSNDLSLYNFPAEYAKAVCAQDFKCCSASELGGKTQADCEQNLRVAANMTTTLVSESQSQGRVTYHGDKAKQCVDDVGRIACADWSSAVLDEAAPASCGQTFEGRVGDGGICTEDLDCISRHCQGVSSGDTQQTTEICVTPKGLGGACATIDDCIAGLYCDTTQQCATQKSDGTA